MWLARYAGFRRPHSHLTSGGLGTMGYSMPAAMGAALGRPGQGDLGDLRRRRLPDDDPGAGDAGPGPHPGQDRPPGQQEAGDDPPVAGDHLRGQLPLVEPARPRLREAGRGLRHPVLPGQPARGGRRRHPRRPGGRRPGARLVRDRREPERLPDDAGRQGPLRPHRDVERAEDERTRDRADRARRSTGAPRAARQLRAAPAHSAPPARAVPGSGARHRHVLVAIVSTSPAS